MFHGWFPTRKALELTFACFQLQVFSSCIVLNNWSWKQANVNFKAFLVENQPWHIITKLDNYKKSTFSPQKNQTSWSCPSGSDIRQIEFPPNPKLAEFVLFIFLALKRVLAALESGIGTCLVLCHLFSFQDNVGNMYIFPRDQQNFHVVI
jgi:hypothetical protein